MKKFHVVSIIAVLALFCSEALFALPRFALMTGAKCGSCHVNPTGGQMRSEYGTSFSLDALPLVAHKEEDFTFNPKLTDNITIGGDFRTQFLYDMAMSPGDSVKGKNTFHAMTATLYGAVQISKKITFYFKQDFLNQSYGVLSGPEVFGVAKILPRSGYIKVGAFMPEYGWRLDDHTSYTRGGDIGFIPGGFTSNGLPFFPNYRDVGIEVGAYIDDFTLTASVLNGSGNLRKLDFTTDKAFAAKLEYIGKTEADSGINYRLGASGYVFKDYRMAGLTAGIGFGDWVLYGEMDWTDGKLNQFAGNAYVDSAKMSVAFVELDYRAIQGLWLTARYETVDPLNGIADDELALTPTTNSFSRLMLGLEFFPYSFVELRPQYHVVMEKPSLDNDRVLVQLHLWF
ncbi:MAG: hypothetical protein EPO24_04840 [Bacteroidetes bacterium]|nr:MAG: hypothetical protein EPO24_04840 [Bacteroidota bacterium]